MFGLIELEYRFEFRFFLNLTKKWGDSGNPNLFLHNLSSLVNVRLHTDNWLCNLPGSALKVPVGGGGWWWL